MRAQLQCRQTLIRRLMRFLAGVLVTAACFQWSAVLESQTWLFPFPFLVAVSMLTAWVTGPPLGWLATASWIGVSGSLTIARAIHGPLTWFYHGDLVAAVLGQGETLGISGIFAIIACLAGLCAWGSAALLQHLLQRRLSRYAPPPR